MEHLPNPLFLFLGNACRIGVIKTKFQPSVASYFRVTSTNVTGGTVVFATNIRLHIAPWYRVTVAWRDVVAQHESNPLLNNLVTQILEVELGLVLPSYTDRRSFLQKVIGVNTELGVDREPGDAVHGVTGQLPLCDVVHSLVKEQRATPHLTFAIECVLILVQAPAHL